MSFICHHKAPNTLFAIKTNHSAGFLHLLGCKLGMASMNEEEKGRNSLGKPADDLITPHEYKLDLLPLPPSFC